MESKSRRRANIIDLQRLHDVENKYMDSLKPTTKISMSALQFITLIGVLVGIGWVVNDTLYDIKSEINSVKNEFALMKMQLQFKGILP